MTALVVPTLDLYASWAAAVREYGGEHLAGSAIPPEDAADDSRTACVRLVERTRREADLTVPAPDGRVHADAYWIVEGGEVVGFIHLRHELNDFLREVGGHIGYSVRPTRRRQGHAGRALALVLARARELGIERALITCEEDNLASARTIEAAGGVLEDVRDGSAYGYTAVRRYWVPL